ncbi:hypothetical protein DFP72DRAFT_1136323, partial [Ephemerocybe angulata]
AQVFSSRYTNYFAVASLTVLIADYLQTVDLEIALIWPTRLNLVKLVYYVNRYLPFVFLPVIIFYNVAPPLSPKQACKILFSVPCMGIACCLLVSEVILYIRVYALSGKTRPMVIFLALHGSAIIIVCLILFAWYQALGRFAPSPFPEVAGCFGVSSANGKFVLACFSLLLYNGIVTTGLCIWFGLKMYWISRDSALVKIFYRDGTFYFVMLVALSLTNGLVALLAPAKYRFMMAIPQEVMHNVISSRMILHIREHARVDMGFTALTIDLQFEDESGSGQEVNVGSSFKSVTDDVELDSVTADVTPGVSVMSKYSSSGNSGIHCV